MHIDKRGGAVKTLCNTQRQHLHRWLYAYSKLLKLTAVSNAGVYIKLAILAISRMMTGLAYRMWADEGVGAVNDVHSYTVFG